MKLSSRSRSWAKRAKERANMSFFIFVIFFAVFALIVFTEIVFLEKPNTRVQTVQYDSQNSASISEALPETSELPPPAYVPKDAVWQPVAGTKYKFYVYSAYVERRKEAAIRIIAATKTRGPDPVLCRIWLPNNQTHIVGAKIKAIRENWSLKYSATYILCKLGDVNLKPEETIGASVAVLSASHPTLPHSNLLPVLDTEPQQGIEDNLHVCVKPFHYTFGRDEWLIEWFEMNRLLGVNHFYMYNHSMSPSVGCLLEHYRKQGLVTLLPWNLPITTKVEIRTEGQFASFNDCLYRSMARAAWLLVIDVDELVLPRRERTLRALLSTVTTAYNPPSKAPAALLFRNAFFYYTWDDDSEAPAPLVTSRKTRRWATPHPLKSRSKYAVRPSLAVELGNHFIWELVAGSVAAGVAPERALLHHYRVVCEFGGDSCMKVPSVVDRTAHRWADELNLRVKSTNHTLHKECY